MGRSGVHDDVGGPAGVSSPFATSCFVPGSPPVTRIERSQALISYQNYHMLLLFLSQEELCAVFLAQLVPSSHYANTLRPTLRVLVNQALV